MIGSGSLYIWRFALVAIALLGALVKPALAEVQDNFLPVEEAFKLQARIDGEQLNLKWEVAPGYYLYQERFKLTRDGEPLTPSFSPAELKLDPYFEKEMLVYEQEALLSLSLAGEQQPFNLRIVSQGCAYAGLCYPPRSEYLRVDPLQKTIASISAEEANQGAANTAGGAASELEGKPMSAWLFEAILFAMLGGMILNLMPCVFPVLSIKVISLAQADRAHLAAHGWVYTLGIVLCFLGFAGVLMLARAGGEAIGWGFQLQSPYLITALAYLFFVMGLSLSGMLNIGTSWMGAGQSLTERSGMSGSFFTGVLAAVVASPCTAPFMGVALGYALTQPGFVSLIIFAALGFGMALPMLVLCYMPALVDKLPRPGTWMETLKEILAFPLYLTSVWLLWVLGRQAGVNTLVAVCVGAVLIVFGIWLLNRPANTTFGKWLSRATIASAWVVAILFPLQLLSGKEDNGLWQAYTPSALEQARSEGKPVLINLTADWCITCLANERVALGTDDVEAALEELGVVTLKGDWTNHDATITALLSEYGRSGVPLYLWFPEGHQGKGIVLPQILQKGTLLDTLKGEAKL